MKKIEDVYLGDGVYASFDGYHISLDLRGQDNTTKIALDPRVVSSLESYIKRVKETVGKDSEQT